MIPYPLRATPRPLLAASVLFFGAAYLTVNFPDTPGAGVASFVSTFLIAYLYSRYSTKTQDPLADKLRAEFESEIGR